MATYVYMVECADHSYYTGWTNDVEARIAAHNAGTGARYTRGRGPVLLVYLEETADKPIALQREWIIKKLTHAQKKQLISDCSVKHGSRDSAGGMQRCLEDQQNQEVTHGGKGPDFAKCNFVLNTE